MSPDITLTATKQRRTPSCMCFSNNVGVQGRTQDFLRVGRFFYKYLMKMKYFGLTENNFMFIGYLSVCVCVGGGGGSPLLLDTILINFIL